MKNLKNIQINLFHIIIVGPLFIYLWFYQVYLKQRISDNLLLALMLMGILIILYHIYIIYKKTQ